jgi:Ca2+-binding EF-hand superfamily protein
MEELIELMHEIDVDRNGYLDIDEFVALMTSTGDEMQFQNANAKATLMNIRKARKLNPLDFFKSFKSMP